MSNQNPNHGNISTPELTVIGADTRIKGEMFFEKSARILGHFEGKITAQGEVQIGNGANCNAAGDREYRIRVYRASGSTTCAGYTLTLSNGTGGGF